MFRLSVRTPGKPERIFQTDDGHISIGRGSSNLLTIENPHISTQHARIDVSTGGANLVDSGSTNGTMIQRGGQKIAVHAGSKGTPLKVGDIVVLGDSAAPVSLVIIDDATGASTHPVSDPPTTAVSEAPVVASTVGQVVARRSAELFGVLPNTDNRPKTAQALFDFACAIAGRNLPTVIDCAVVALQTVCPAVSHVFVGIGRDAKGQFKQVNSFPRSAADMQPNRVLVAKATMSGEAWLVERAVFAVGEKHIEVPNAICVPIVLGEQDVGAVLVDNRGNTLPLTENDLALVAALTHLLGTAVTALGD